MKERTCLICGRTYVKVIGVSFAKYCSEECRAEGNRLQGKIRYKRTYKPKENNYYVKHCVICGKEFSSPQSTAKYCSNKCRNKNKKKGNYICKCCGKVFSRERRGHDAYKFCSRECSAKYVLVEQANREAAKSLIKKEKKLICSVCGNVFKSKRAGVKYCSDKCLHEAQKERNKILAPIRFKPQSKKCRYCGKMFITRFKHSKCFCSDECKAKMVKVRRKNNKRRLKGKIIDRDISLKRLAKQSGNVCALCGDVVDWNDYKIDNDTFIAGDNYPSIDHIIPLAEGGLHSWDNVQLAHRKCNYFKGGSFLVSEMAWGG